MSVVPRRVRNSLMLSQVYWLPRYYFLFKISRFKRGEFVLDAGCGEGIVAIGLAKRGLRVIGIDKSVAKIKEAARLLASLIASRDIANRIDFIVGDLGYLPFKENHFDQIISLDTFEYIPDDLKALSECARILKAGGKLKLTLPLGYACSGRLFFPQRILRKLIPPFFFSRELSGAKSWLESDEDDWSKRIGDVRRYTVEEIKKRVEIFFKPYRYTYFLKIFSSLATDIIYGIRGLWRFKFIFFYITVRLDYYFQRKNFGYGLFLELIKKDENIKYL